MKCFTKLENVVSQLQVKYQSLLAVSKLSKFYYLKGLHSKFFSIILQEGLKSFQTEEPTTLAMASDLENFINDAGVSLEELVQDIDSKILCQRKIINILLDI